MSAALEAHDDLVRRLTGESCSGGTLDVEYLAMRCATIAAAGARMTGQPAESAQARPAQHCYVSGFRLRAALAKKGLRHTRPEVRVDVVVSSERLRAERQECRARFALLWRCWKHDSNDRGATLIPLPRGPHKSDGGLDDWA